MSSKKVIWLIVGLVVLAAAVLVGVRFIHKPAKKQPTASNQPKLDSSGYPVGTVNTVSTILPVGFPKELILGSPKLDRVQLVTYPDYHQDTTVNYNSTDAASKVFTAYITALTNAHWHISGNQAGSSVSMLQAAKGAGPSFAQVFITIDNFAKLAKITVLYKK